MLSNSFKAQSRIHFTLTIFWIWLAHDIGITWPKLQNIRFFSPNRLKILLSTKPEERWPANQVDLPPRHLQLLLGKSLHLAAGKVQVPGNVELRKGRDIMATQTHVLKITYFFTSFFWGILLLWRIFKERQIEIEKYPSSPWNRICNCSGPI